MKKSNSKSKALGAFKKLGAVALITATMFFTACNQTGNTGGGSGTPKPKHAITFSVDITTPNGTLKAKADGVPETSTSPINIEEGKTVTFTAKANDGYRVKGWTLDGKPITLAGTNTEYKLKVSKPATVSVSFEAIPKHVINFSVDSTTPNGTLKAEGDGITQPATSPINVEEGKEITFTAKANDGYRVKGWTLDGKPITEAGTNTEYKLNVTKPATVSVSFELSPVEGGAVLILSPDNLTIRVTANTEDGSAITVEGCTVATLASGTKTTLTATGTKVVLKGKITVFDCSREYSNMGSLTALNVQGLTALQMLDCQGNRLTSLNVQGLTALQELLCSGNQLPELNVQGLTALQELLCSGNQLPELNVQGLTALKNLWCSGNQLTELNVQGLTALQMLDCQGNRLTSLNVQGLTALKWVNCRNNQLTALNVQGCTALQGVECSQNQLNAQAMTEILNALPTRAASDDAKALLYTEETDEPEGNHKDYNMPADLKKAFEDAKKRNWTLQKRNASGDWVDI